MNMITKESLVKECEERVKGQKPVLLFLCMLPFLLFFGIMAGSFWIGIFLSVVLAIILVVRQNIVKKDLNSMKKDNFKVYFDTIKELPHTGGGYNHRPRTYYIVTERFFKSRREVFPTTYDALAVGDGVIIVLINQKIFNVYTLKDNSVGIDIENKLENYEDYKELINYL